MLLRAKIIQPKFNFGLKVIRKFSSLQRRESSCIQQIVLDKYCDRSSSIHSRFLSLTVARCSEESSVKEELIFQIPDKPAPPTSPDTNIEAATSSSNEIVFTLPEKPTPVDVSLLGEPSLESLGLASWWPSGRMQYLLENLHLGLGLEWYQAIALATLCMRVLMIPAVVMAQRNMAHMNNNLPAMSALQEKITDARRRGDMFEMAQLTQELQILSQKQGINPLKNIAPMAVQLPIFMSFFIGLRGMSNCPVESMSSGGILWFENLTLADPFYLLPLMTCCTTFLQLKVGADGARMDLMGPKMKVAMMVLPFLLFPITMNFASAVTFYWMTTNIISLAQTKFFRIPRMRKLCNIPTMIEHKKVAPPKGPKKGFRESVRDTLDNFRAMGQIVDKRAYDEKIFREAGKAKPLKTYKYDPTKIKAR